MKTLIKLLKGVKNQVEQSTQALASLQPGQDRDKDTLFLTPLTESGASEQNNHPPPLSSLCVQREKFFISQIKYLSELFYTACVSGY